MSAQVLTQQEREAEMNAAKAFAKVLDWHYSKAVTDSTIQQMQEDIMAYGQAMFQLGFRTAKRMEREREEAAKKAQEATRCSN